MTSNDTGFAEMEDIGMAQNLSDSVCEPVPASICKGHPYMCLCKQEKVTELYKVFFELMIINREIFKKSFRIYCELL